MIPTVVYQIIACVDSRLVRNMMSTYNLRFYKVSKTETGRLFATPESLLQLRPTDMGAPNRGDNSDH